MEDLRNRLLQVLEFHAEGEPPGWPDDAHWPENDGALNAGWLKALYIHVYGDDFRLHGHSPFVVNGHTCERGSDEYCRILHSLIAEGMLEVIVDPEALHGHRFRYTLPK